MTHSDSPIFILGANRSGTTLLRLILNAHSRIAIPDEVKYFEKVQRPHFARTWFTHAFSETGYAHFVDRALDRHFSYITEEVDRDCLYERIMAAPERDYRQPYKMALETWAAHHHKPRWGEKTPSNLFYVDVLIDMFPSARFIYLARDPRAGVRSMQYTSFFPNDVILNALSRRKHATVAYRLLRRHVPAAQWTALRYEDLVADPEPITRSLCRFLGEAYEPSMLAFHQDAEKYLNDEAARSYNAAATRPITTEKLERWRHDLEDRNIAIIERICRPEMEHFGYEPTGHRLPIRYGPDLLIKVGYWYLQCWRNRDLPHYTVKHRAFMSLWKNHLAPLRSAFHHIRRALPY